MENAKSSPSEIASRHGIDLEHELKAGFAARQIRGFARWLARKTHQGRDDISQDLSLRLLDRVRLFDPARAKWEAFVIKVLKSYCASQFQARYRQRRYTKVPIQSLSAQTVDEEGQSTTLGQELLSPHQVVDAKNSTECTFDQLDSRIMVRHLIAQLPLRQRRICRLLGEDSIAGIRRRLKIPRKQMDRLLEKIRKTFVDEGFGDGFEE